VSLFPAFHYIFQASSKNSPLKAAWQAWHAPAGRLKLKPYDAGADAAIWATRRFPNQSAPTPNSTRRTTK
jgi:hypothetical protein